MLLATPPLIISNQATLGYVGDLIGHRLAMLLTLSLAALGAFCSAVLPVYENARTQSGNVTNVLSDIAAADTVALGTDENGLAEELQAKADHVYMVLTVCRFVLVSQGVEA